MGFRIPRSRFFPTMFTRETKIKQIYGHISIWFSREQIPLSKTAKAIDKAKLWIGKQTWGEVESRVKNMQNRLKLEVIAHTLTTLVNED